MIAKILEKWLALVLCVLFILLTFIGLTTIVHSNKVQSFNIESQINTAEESRSLINALQTADKGDVIIIHLAGYGGDGETMMVLVSAIRASSAMTIAVVEAPVYSAHAYIALACDKVLMQPYTTLMLHNGSNNNINCDEFVGLKDRGHDESVKCKQMQAAVNYMVTGLLNTFTLITPEERSLVENGYDLYLTSDEVIFREQTGMAHEQHPIPDPIVPAITIQNIQKLLNAK